MESWRSVVIHQLNDLVNPQGILERSDVDVRALEGLTERIEVMSGEVPEQAVEIQEFGLKYRVNMVQGHKTGFYLDQRDNRHLATRLLGGPRVLNCFAYTGGFTLSALKAGSHEVVSIETSDSAVALAKENVLANGFDLQRCKWINEDVFVELRKMRDRAEKFDAIVLDPPRFASSSRQINRAARGYKDINLLAFKLLNPGGVLMTFSCSGAIDDPLFQKIVADAALDAGVHASIEGRMSQGADHPVLLSFPEGRYLKGLICRRW
jgi:23S rRNA (cytosine1962-C5)-methyltransferase